MRNSVVVNGVSLTREQIEQAIKELNKPEPVVHKRGDVVRHASHNVNYLVVSRRDIVRLADDVQKNTGIGDEHLVPIYINDDGDVRLSMFSLDDRNVKKIGTVEHSYKNNITVRNNS